MRPLLLDVSALLALLDPYHAARSLLHTWITSNGLDRWATCPLTENGFIRVISQSSYPNPIPLVEAVDILRLNCERSGHEYWPDSISILDMALIHADGLGTPSRITDTYLLALAKHHDGVLVTLDRRISTAAVPDGARHLAVIS